MLAAAPATPADVGNQERARERTWPVSNAPKARQVTLPEAWSQTAAKTELEGEATTAWPDGERRRAHSGTSEALAGPTGK
jgi:hypothetical protein